MKIGNFNCVYHFVPLSIHLAVVEYLLLNASILFHNSLQKSLDFLLQAYVCKIEKLWQKKLG